MRIGEMTLKDAATEAAGNWQRFQCFAWHRASNLPDADNWAIAYTHHRDCGLLDQSNAAAIAAALETFTKGSDPDAIAEHHSHWLVGWVDGFSIRVCRRGRITKAFRAYHRLAQRLAEYPILDEEDYSRREYEGTISNLTAAAWRLRNQYGLPEGWEPLVYDWLSENNYSAISNQDDQGGYPSEDQLRAAFHSLGYCDVATIE